MREETVLTEILIAAPPQVVWSILDDLDRYSEWNRTVPTISGRTTVGAFIDAEIGFTGMGSHAFRAEILRVVPGRELRWMSRVLTEPVSTAEHFFVLEPTADGGTRFVHGETFAGPMVEMIWPMMDTVARADYEAMNRDLKHRAEAALASPAPPLHPVLEADSCGTGIAGPVDLQCLCPHSPVTVRVEGPWRHAHLCGCSQCWRPGGAAMALIAAVPAGSAVVTAHEDKLAPVDPARAILRHACKECGTHLVGRVTDPDHHFFGLDFVHPELGPDPCPWPEFAGFVSSLVEQGISPTAMAAIRLHLAGLGIAAHDGFSPEIMDMIAWHRGKIARQTLSQG